MTDDAVDQRQPLGGGASGRPLGVLCVVLGPSGVGKDTLLAGARARLESDPGFEFARRAITRPAATDRDGGGAAREAERHEPLNEAAFAAASAAGAFFVEWRAHGLRYGAPASIGPTLRAGRHVVLNGSRAALAETAARAAAVGARAAAIHVDAPSEVVADRLRRRGRESAAEIEARRARPRLVAPEGVRVFDVINDGGVEAGVERLVAALYAASRLEAAAPGSAADRTAGAGAR